MEKWKKHIVIGTVIVVLTVGLILVFDTKEDKLVSQNPNQVGQHDKNKNEAGQQEEDNEEEEGMTFDELYGGWVDPSDKKPSDSTNNDSDKDTSNTDPDKDTSNNDKDNNTQGGATLDFGLLW